MVIYRNIDRFVYIQVSVPTCVSLLCQLRGQHPVATASLVPAAWFPISASNEKKQALWEVADFRVGTGNIQDKPGTSSVPESNNVLKTQTKPKIHHEGAMTKGNEPSGQT